MKEWEIRVNDSLDNSLRMEQKKKILERSREQLCFV